MNDDTIQQFKDHAIAEFPRECCGLVAVVRGKERYLPCRNVADVPTKRFVIHQDDYAKAEELGEIIAVAHSHCNGSNRPSDADKTLCEATGVQWHIVSVSAGDCSDICTFEPCGYEAPLVGRNFAHGILDCYTLIKDYYLREQGIELPEFEREDEWWNKGQTLYTDNFAAAGFSKIAGQMQVGDIILMQIRAPTPNHAAVYIGDGLILHHLANRMSSRDVYDGYFQEVSVMVLRHKERQ